MLLLNIFKPQKSNFKHFWWKIKLLTWGLFFLWIRTKYLDINTVQTAMISKDLTKFWSKFQIHVLWYSYTRDVSFPVNPYQSPSRKLYPRASRHINNSLTVHFFLNSEMQLCKSKVLNNLGYSLRKVYKLFFVTKKGSA